MYDPKLAIRWSLDWTIIFWRVGPLVSKWNKFCILQIAYFHVRRYFILILLEVKFEFIILLLRNSFWECFTLAEPTMCKSMSNQTENTSYKLISIMEQNCGEGPIHNVKYKTRQISEISILVQNKNKEIT